MFIKSSNKTRGGWTLAEFMVAAAVFSVASVAMIGLFGFSVRSFAALTNYGILDQANREAMDLLTREIRQAKYISNFTTNTITVLTGDTPPLSVTYSFSPSTKQMLRTATDGVTTTTQVLLENCNLLSFSLFTRVPISGTYDAFPVATTNWAQTVKVVQLTWKTSTTLPNAAVNSENVQTARIVIRKQDDGVSSY
jgi:Tfp pilus assembly protein PilW